MLFPPVVTKNTSCELCPRACHADRTTTQKGVCGNDYRMRIGRIMLHEWEEPSLSYGNGAGAIFFGGCPLGCVYCQNMELSHFGAGVYRTIEELTEEMLLLEQRGASCIDLVSATPFAYEVVSALEAAKKQGLSLPIVWNTGGYETLATLSMLDGMVDVYLPDLKTLSVSRAKRYLHAADYPTVAKSAISEMVRQTGTPQFNEKGGLVRGTLVRHLVLPHGMRDTMRVLSHLALYGDDILVSLMSQYTPPPYLAVEEYPEISKPLVERDYKLACRYAEDVGIEKLYTQDVSSASCSYIPEWEYPPSPFDLFLKMVEEAEKEQ